MNIVMTEKRVYCPDCHVLVDVHQKGAGESSRITCCRCERPIWIKSGLNWKWVKKVTAATPQPVEAKTPEAKEVKTAAKPEPRREAKQEGRTGAPRETRRTPRAPRSEARPARGPRPASGEARPAPKQEPKTDVKPEAKT